jgi:hypothetical protein
MSFSLQLFTVTGVVTTNANGATMTAGFASDSAFSHELTQALMRGHNPAQALIFLAELAVKNCHPHHCESLSHRDRMEWEMYFGAERTGNLPPDTPEIVPV